MLDPLQFPIRFRQTYGRNLRVLHIGNVANYAYTNAKLQRELGIDADCLDPNFFHIMASPEWLEAPVEGDHGDDFQPRWSQVHLGGYRRPDWFVQGDETLAFAYLKAKIARNSQAMTQILRRLEIHRRAFTNDTPLPDGLFQMMLGSSHPALRFTRRVVKNLVQGRQTLDLPAPDTTANFGIWPPAEIEPYIQRAASFRPVLEYYDVIHGYTVQAVYAAAAGLPNFVSYELGTIRGLPFEDSPMGRLTRWVYLMSPEVFVTNLDCMPAAERMGLDMRHVHKTLHAFDIDAAITFARRWSEPQDPSRRPLFYAPARQHWRHGNESILKGNDVALHAAALLKQRGFDFQLVLGEWGSEVHLSKQLVDDLGLSDVIAWEKPLPRHKLWPTIKRACAILDQFRSPAFGGVSLETMALGQRLITGYDNNLGSTFFSEEPPIMNCRTAEQVANAMEACIRDPLDAEGLGLQAQSWMARQHSVERQMREQFACYESLLSRLRYSSSRWVLDTVDRGVIAV